jgi:protoporphyrin/coproporphyrin ferrochelatase
LSNLNDNNNIGVLLVNTGTPDLPDSSSVRRYLAEFLWDKRIVDTPRWLWFIILHAVILRVRPSRSAEKYTQIWMDDGSPLLQISLAQRAALQLKLNKDNIFVELGMRYGNPSIEQALESLKSRQVDKIVILPLFPQYCSATTASVFDEVANVFKSWRFLPEIRMVNSYSHLDNYAQALADKIQAFWQVKGLPEKLLFSFHGIPQRYVNEGDPYAKQCKLTAKKVAKLLKLQDSTWDLSYQSRVGVEKWLQPYTEPTVAEYAEQGIKRLDVVCPGFSADCLETLEEIDLSLRQTFIASGGDSFNYISALNSDPSHMDLLADIVKQHSQGWI